MNNRPKVVILGSAAKDASEERLQVLGDWAALHDSLDAFQELLYEIEDQMFDLLDRYEEAQEKPVPAQLV